MLVINLAQESVTPETIDTIRHRGVFPGEAIQLKTPKEQTFNLVWTGNGVRSATALEQYLFKR